VPSASMSLRSFNILQPSLAKALLKERIEAGSEKQDASGPQTMRKLNPKLKCNALRFKLAAVERGGSPQCLTSDFWIKEIELVCKRGFIEAPPVRAKSSNESAPPGRTLDPKFWECGCRSLRIAAYRG